jgi:hypothetical protein
MRYIPCDLLFPRYAEVAELVDALDSGFSEPSLQVKPSKRTESRVLTTYKIFYKEVNIVNWSEKQGYF